MNLTGKKKLPIDKILKLSNLKTRIKNEVSFAVFICIRRVNCFFSGEFVVLHFSRQCKYALWSFILITNY